MKTSWFTFGFDHLHYIDGRVFNHDCAVKITAPDPRAVMIERFGTTWCWEYDHEPEARYIPRGVFTIDLTAKAAE